MSGWCDNGWFLSLFYFPMFSNFSIISIFHFFLYLACVIYIVQITYTCLKYFRIKLAGLDHWLERGVWGISLPAWVLRWVVWPPTETRTGELLRDSVASLMAEEKLPRCFDFPLATLPPGSAGLWHSPAAHSSACQQTHGSTGLQSSVIVAHWLRLCVTPLISTYWVSVVCSAPSKACAIKWWKEQTVPVFIKLSPMWETDENV